MATRPHGLPATARRRSPSSSVRPTGARSRKAGSMYRGQRSGGSMMWMSLSRTLKAPCAMAHLLRVCCEERAGLRDFGPRALAGQLHQLREVAPGLRLVAALGRRLRSAVVGAEALGLAGLHGLELLQRVRRALELQQHVAQELARGQDAPGRDDVLLVAVLHVGGVAHEAERLVLLALRQRRPRRHAEPVHLDLVGP